MQMKDDSLFKQANELGMRDEVEKHQSKHPKNEYQHSNSQLNNTTVMKDQSQTPTLIRIPFYVKSQQILRKILTQQHIQKINDKEDSINLTFNSSSKIPFSTNLVKKKLLRPMQSLRVKKLVNRKTGKIIRIIKAAENIELLYDYEQMGDFISTSGTQTLYSSKRYSLQQQDLLKQLKRYLGQKITSKDTQQQDPSQTDKYLKLIQPLSFLKSYNFTPPLCDMLTNKIKLRQETGNIVAKSISYDEQIPQPIQVDVPKHILEGQLFKKISVYMERRPCWLKNSLYYALYQDGMRDTFTVNDFKTVMKYTAFTYRNGPWKHIFCKFGFDPKKQSKSVIYQTIAIKLKEKQAQDYGNQVQEDVYDPTFQQISNKCIRSYQLCDIANQTIRQIVQGKLISKQGQCTKQNGWLNSTQYVKIMKIMKMTIQ